MDDGAPGRRAKSTNEWHQRHGIRLFPGWPGWAGLAGPGPGPGLFPGWPGGAGWPGWPHQSCKEGLEGHHSRVPRKSLQQHAEAHGGSDSRGGYAIQNTSYHLSYQIVLS